MNTTIPELSGPMALTAPALESLISQVRADIRAQPSANRAPWRAGVVGVVPIWGVLRQRGGTLLDAFVSGSTTEAIAADVRRFAADPSISAIVLDVDSPGGTVAGVQECADVIFKARGAKPIIAVANSLCASAAYWLASQADTIIASPSAQVGSIGVFTAHEDVSKMAADAGIKITLISAGRWKTDGNQFEPLSVTARNDIQARIDEVFGQFVGAVARGRGVSATDVRTGFGEGRIVSAKRAVALGMADRVGTLEDALARASGSASAYAASADAWLAVERRISAHRARMTALPGGARHPSRSSHAAEIERRRLQFAR